MLGLEDTGSRMSRIGSADLSTGDLPSIDGLLARIDSVTIDDIAREAAAILSVPKSLTVIGPFEESRRFSLG